MRQSSVSQSGLLQLYVVIFLILGWVWFSPMDAALNPVQALLSIFQK